MSESKIQNKIIKYLNSIGAYTIKTISTNRSGSPDIICCLNGKFVGLEVKNEKGVVSELQKYHLEEIKNSGGVSAVVRSVEDVKVLLN
jgi:Holliday junction resolvase